MSDLLQTSFRSSRLLLGFMKCNKQELVNVLFDNKRKIEDPFCGEKQQVVHGQRK
ncbi:hypothetical protein RvY_02152 [Ramazzottius varieornatus]|uniref:Uncharacterized protein n=1 Tax=Ramazzottius varieornatus TaxID=947166 RepID=A0A1D1UPP0_RAMVA|nr:hypothetical protein RvY_02152 [Ramazzottius varieornatus]